MPTNTAKLKARILEMGFTHQIIAKKLDISLAASSNKIHNRAEFKATEIQKICELLKITDKDPYFFCDNSSQNGYYNKGGVISDK